MKSDYKLHRFWKLNVAKTQVTLLVFNYYNCVNSHVFTALAVNYQSLEVRVY